MLYIRVEDLQDKEPWVAEVLKGVPPKCPECGSALEIRYDFQNIRCTNKECTAEEIECLR